MLSLTKSLKNRQGLGEGHSENTLMLRQRTNKTNYSKSTANFVGEQGVEEEEKKSPNEKSSLKTSSSMEDFEECKVGPAQIINKKIQTFKHMMSNGSRCFTVKEDTNEPMESFNTPDASKIMNLQHLQSFKDWAERP